MNERQKKFAELYAANPNATEAAKKAGYSEKTARSQGQRLLTNVDIINYIKTLREEAAIVRIAGMSSVKAFWSDTMNNPAEKTSDRLKASELLAKASGAFLRENINEYDSDEEMDDVIIYFPAKENIERSNND